MFSGDFPNMACCLHIHTQSLNNNKRPNKKNDVITDLGGEGDFPMFRFGPRLLALPRSTALTHAAFTHTSLTHATLNRATLTHPGTHAAVACRNLTTLTHRGGRAARIARPTDARRGWHFARREGATVLPTVSAFPA